MKWSPITVNFPQGPTWDVGIAVFALVMLSINIGLIVAMRYERRVR